MNPRRLFEPGVVLVVALSVCAGVACQSTKPTPEAEIPAEEPAQEASEETVPSQLDVTPTPPPPEEPIDPAAQPCGGLEGLGCAEGQYCFYPIEAQCGAADQSGICRPIPEVCTQEYDPVCGCDGTTYSNACQAAAAGIAFAQKGEC